jgi:hypothetical protein
MSKTPAVSPGKPQKTKSRIPISPQRTSRVELRRLPKKRLGNEKTLWISKACGSPPEWARMGARRSSS